MRAILLVDHGSRIAAANRIVADVATSLGDSLGEGALVAYAHQEGAAPSVDEAIAVLAARGVTELVVVPFFLVPGRHATDDVPRLAREASARHPGLRIETLAPPLPDAISALAAIVHAKLPR